MLFGVNILPVNLFTFFKNVDFHLESFALTQENLTWEIWGGILTSSVWLFFISCYNFSRIPQGSWIFFPRILPGSCNLMEDHSENPGSKIEKKMKRSKWQSGLNQWLLKLQPHALPLCFSALTQKIPNWLNFNVLVAIADNTLKCNQLGIGIVRRI